MSAPGERLKDPVCGMEFTRAEAESLGAETLEHDGRTLHFCSGYCKAQFAARQS